MYAKIFELLNIYKDGDATLFKWCRMIDDGHEILVKVVKNMFSANYANCTNIVKLNLLEILKCRQLKNLMV